MRSSADVPARFRERSLATYQPETPSQTNALAAARRLAAGLIRGLVLIGPTGVGKSHLAAGVVNAMGTAIDIRRATRRQAWETWAAESEAHAARQPKWPEPTPESVAALRVWREARDERETRKTKWAAIREDHWNRRPDEPRPSAEWDAWDAEAKTLEPKMRELLGGEPLGPLPVTEASPAAMAEYRERHAAWEAERQEVNAARPVMVHEPEPAWENVAELILDLRAEIGRPHDEREAEERITALRHHAALVVLDDLGREKTSDWTGETIYALVNARYEAMLPTLVTSNLTATELGMSPYWPVISRLAEDGALVEITAPDRRLRR